jgi:hypothetical protein
MTPSPTLSYADAMKSLFPEVLLKCNELGLIGGELFAIDGCKPLSPWKRVNTRRRWNWRSGSPMCSESLSGK